MGGNLSAGMVHIFKRQIRKRWVQFQSEKTIKNQVVTTAKFAGNTIEAGVNLEIIVGFNIDV